MGRQNTVEVSVFQPSNVFVTLSTIPFQETAPLARALQSVILEPSGFNVLNSNDDLTFPGFTADVPGIQSRPLQLALDNFLILSSLTAQFESRLQETRQNLLDVQETLQSGIRNSNPAIRNRAESILESSLLAQLIATAQQAGLLEQTPEPSPVAQPKFVDYTFRPTETAVFGSTYSGVTRESGLGSAFVSGTSLAASDQVFLSDLLIGSQSATATHYAVSIRSEIGGTAAAEILDAGNNAVANGTVITAAELSTFSIRAASGGLGSLDFFSIVELRDPEGDAIIEGRGAFQTVSINSGAILEDRSEGSSGEEKIRDYTFFTESGKAFTRMRLQISGVNSLGFTDALAAIEAGALRVKIGETLLDGSVNRGQIDRANSSGDTLVVVFPFQAAEDGIAQNGLDVELRAVDSGFDLSTVTARAEFP